MEDTASASVRMRRGEALYSQVQSAVDQARGEGADYVIMVGHLGDNGITEKWSSEA